MKYMVTLLPGDGIGPEVTQAAIRILSFIAGKYKIELKLTEKTIGGDSIDKNGVPITEDTLKSCYQSDAIFLGAVGGYKWENLENHLKPEAGLLSLRKSLQLYANIRPARIYSSFFESSSLKRDVLEGTDFIVLRELTGDIYFGEPRGMDQTHGWNTMSYTFEEVERIATMAFAMARNRKKKVISVDKANVLECSQFWRSVVEEVHKKYDDIKLQHMYVDNAAMQFVRYPKQFDVILTSNLFGDIISDIAAMITGSIGMLPSASLGEKYSLFEPVHGSAPDIGGQDKANPIAAIASIGMMFEYAFKIPDAARKIDQAIELSLEQGYRTIDIYRDNDSMLISTSKMTKNILLNLNDLYSTKSIHRLAPAGA
jgi:3-isopropylmalate dehydrogenase